MDEGKRILDCVDRIIESKDRTIKRLETKIKLLEIELIRKDEKIELAKIAINEIIEKNSEGD